MKTSLPSFVKLLHFTYNLLFRYETHGRTHSREMVSRLVGVGEAATVIAFYKENEGRGIVLL